MTTRPSDLPNLPAHRITPALAVRMAAQAEATRRALANPRGCAETVRESTNAPEGLPE